VLDRKLKYIIILALLLISGILHAKPDIEIVKQRVLAEILRESVDDEEISALIHSMGEDGSWPDINYEDLSRTGFENLFHLFNLEKFCLAYQQRSSSFYHDRKLRRLVNQSLKFWCDHDYISENWYDNQVTTPRKMVNVLLLMDGDIEPALQAKALQISQRGSLDSPGARPGADRIKFGDIAAKRGLVVGDEAGFADIMKAINNEIKFNTGGRGMQHDYSFHHRYDRVNTTYSYGTAYADVFAEWAAYVAGTEFEFTANKIEQLIDYYLDGICKQAVYGIYQDKGAMNRSISRKETFKPLSTRTPERLLIASNHRKDELEEVISLRKGISGPTDSFATFFWQSEHFVCQRPTYYTSVRMFSVRNQNMEYPHNSEGILNHHKGDGANFLSIKGNEYLNIWPVYDWQKIPGTTILQKPALPPENKVLMPGLTGFVGAVTDEEYGAVAFDFISPHDFTRARKGWFFFDDEYVCLGAGIETPTRTLPVVTTMNQSLLKGDVIVSHESAKQTLDRGVHLIDNAKWVFHNGTGYLFPDSTTINLSNQEESGKWTDITKQSRASKDLVTLDVFSLWIDHGIRPQGNTGGFNYSSTIPKDVKYEYIVVPVTTVEQMNEDRGIEVLMNNRKLQAVIDHDAGLVQAIFYQAGELNIAEGIELSLDSPGAVMVKINEGKVKKITVADPSRSLSRMHLQITGMNDLNIELPEGVYAGQSINANL
jgi:chondroitin AC lyase